MSKGNPSVQARVKPANYDKLKQFAAKAGYKTVSDAARALLIKQLAAEGYNPEPEHDR